MSQGRRRSGRLIANPWLFSWPKKPPAYIDLCSSENKTSFKGNARNSSRSTNSDARNRREGHSPITFDELDIRTERKTCNRVGNTSTSDDEEDFVTPREMFSDSSKSGGSRCSTKKKPVNFTGKLTMIDKACRTYAGVDSESQDELKLLNQYKEHEGTKERTLSLRNRTETENIKRSQIDNKKQKVACTRGTVKGNLALKINKKVGGPMKKKFDDRKEMSLDGTEQMKWVETAGFGALLHFRMLCYPHNLGYNIVEAFDAETCSIGLQAGSINITESIVHGVMGIPIGNEIIEFGKKQDTYSEWGSQFPENTSSEITPSMVRDKILENPIADSNFKWNFLIMMYNFFIESNQNSFLTRSVLRFSGDIEECGNYNWCRLLIEKLKKTHAYWAANTKRNFTGPLPFLIYLYVSKLHNEGTAFVRTNYLTYRGWSDMLLWERQKYDASKRCFGEGKIVKFCKVTVNGVVQIQGEYEDCSNHTEMTTRDIIVGSNITNEGGIINRNYGSEIRDIPPQDNFDVRTTEPIAPIISSENDVHDFVIHDGNVEALKTKKSTGDSIILDYTATKDFEYSKGQSYCPHETAAIETNVDHCVESLTEEDLHMRNREHNTVLSKGQEEDLSSKKAKQNRHGLSKKRHLIIEKDCNDAMLVKKRGLCAEEASHIEMDDQFGMHPTTLKIYGCMEVQLVLNEQNVKMTPSLSKGTKEVVMSLKADDTRSDVSQKNTVMTAEQYMDAKFLRKDLVRLDERKNSATDGELDKWASELECIEKLNHTVPKNQDGGALSTQTRMDDEVEHHYKEDSYMRRFEGNLNDLKEVYDKCVDNFEVAFALYPKNSKLAELQEKFSDFFKMFGASSPISRVSSAGNIDNNDRTHSCPADEEHFIPKFSLGLSQMTPKNLRSVIDENADSVIKSVSDGLRFLGQEKYAMTEGNDDMKAHHKPGDDENKFAGILRPRKGIKASHFCRSPYVSRVIDVSAHQLTPEERNVWDWLFRTKLNMNETLFEWNNRLCTRGHFQSMRENNMIESTVIDTWTYLLNENEILRADNSPLRLFMTSETTYGPLTMEVGEGTAHDTMERNALFDDNMDIVVQMVCDMHNKQYEVKEFDMFIFPIYDSGHHYVICYNMRKPSVEILDNMLRIGDVSDIYGDLPSRLHECFCHWLSIYNVPKEKEIINLVPKVVRMGWQTVQNFVDCAIFAMRHMETYMGNLYKWRVGLRIEKDNQRALLNKLRIIYCHRILTWTENGKRSSILEGASRSGKGKIGCNK